MSYDRRGPPTGSDASAHRIGVLAPLSSPGWVEAGQQLLAGLRLGAEHCNKRGGIAGRPLKLMIRNSGADADKAVLAVEEFAEAGVRMVVGEYHSVCARAVASATAAAGLPFVCSSAVLDHLMEGQPIHIGRIAPPQSRGWRTYAQWLLAAGHRRVAALMQPSVYWSSGAHIVRQHLEPSGGAVIEVALASGDMGQVCDEISATGATAVLLLLAHPEPAVAAVRAIRRHDGLKHLSVGAPAGQPELLDWETQLGFEGRGIAFLRYLPPRLSAEGLKVWAALNGRLGREPSFVALEGYDSMLVVADLLRIAEAQGGMASDDWARVAVDGARGAIRFSRCAETGIWEWGSAPVQVADRDPQACDRFRILLQA